MEEPHKCKYCGVETTQPDEECYANPKQETLEETAEKYAEPYRCPATNENEYCKHDIISAFNNGAKWQAERSYSEEEMLKAFIEGHNVCRCVTDNSDEAKECFKEWFKTYKTNNK